MNKSDLMAAPATKEKITDKLATDIIDLTFDAGVTFEDTVFIKACSSRERPG